jgi:hypothetical protein
MRTVETSVYDFTELTDAAKDKARTWFRETIDHDWWDSVTDDIEQICPILGVTLATSPVRLMGGGTRQKPCIWFSGFWSQGDGACFEGRYAYAPRASLRIRDYAPQDTELHRIADALQRLQRDNFYQLTAVIRHRGRDCHAYCMAIDVERDSPTGHPIVNRGDDDLIEALRDLANWLYRALEREYEFLTSDEIVDEGMSANGYTFTAEGRRFG